MLPDDVLPRVFSFFDEVSLSTALEVSRKWRKYASDDELWKSLAFKNWTSLATDKDLLPLLEQNKPVRNRWRSIVRETPMSVCRLHKMSKAVCTVTAHQIHGKPVTLPSPLVVERRFSLTYLDTFVVPGAALFYLEPEVESDREEFNGLINYLTERSRAGLVIYGYKRVIVIPPCEYARTQLGYHGSSLVAVVQYKYP